MTVMKNKALIVSTSPFYGGGEYYISNTLSLLEKEMKVEYLLLDKILIEKMRSDTRSIRAFSNQNSFTQWKELKHVINEIKPNLIILNGGSTLYFAPLLWKQKLIYIRHTTNQCVANLFRRLLYILILHFCYCFTHVVVHVSKYSMKEQKLFKKKARCVHNGVIPQSEVSKEPVNPVRFLFVGRTDVSKGVDVIIEAFHNINEQTATVDIVGSGPYSDVLSKLNMPSIRYHGFQNNVDEYYKTCDVFIALSDFENCPFSIIDALNFSMPVITTGVGGIGEMVFDGINGLVITKHSAALQNAVKQLADNPKMVEKMGRKSKEIFNEHFTLDKNIVELKNIIKELL